MTDKITITKKQFGRWLSTAALNAHSENYLWESLVLESQRKEPIERWAVEHADGDVSGLYNDRKMAEERVNGIPSRRIVHLREVESGE